MRLEAVPQGFSPVDPVAVATPLFRNSQKPCVLEITNNFLHSPFRDAYFDGYIAQADFPVSRQAHKDMTVVAEKSPIAHHMPSNGNVRSIRKQKAIGEL
jgi:hypothetical protein